MTDDRLTPLGPQLEGEAPAHFNRAQRAVALTVREAIGRAYQLGLRIEVMEERTLGSAVTVLRGVRIWAEVEA